MIVTDGNVKYRINNNGTFDQRYKAKRGERINRVMKNGAVTKHVFTNYQKYGIMTLLTVSAMAIFWQVSTTPVIITGVGKNATESILGSSSIVQESTPEIVEQWDGIASYYNRAGCLGCHPQLIMANGEPLDDLRLTIAFNKLPLNSHVTVTNKATGNSVQALVTDTGGFEELGRIADLGQAVKNAIGCSDLCDVIISKGNN